MQFPGNRLHNHEEADFGQEHLNWSGAQLFCLKSGITILLSGYRKEGDAEPVKTWIMKAFYCRLINWVFHCNCIGKGRDDIAKKLWLQKKDFLPTLGCYFPQPSISLPCSTITNPFSIATSSQLKLFDYALRCCFIHSPKKSEILFGLAGIELQASWGGRQSNISRRVPTLPRAVVLDEEHLFTNISCMKVRLLVNNLQRPLMD
jgi:hypothetical protein